VPLASQIALALRASCGLDLRQIADGLLTSEAALAQRLARARVALAGQTLEAPAGAELAPRREAVLATLMLMFQAGWHASGRLGERERGEAEALALSWEAIRLARALAAHPAAAHADADALAALLLLHGARLSGRLDAAGDIVPLAGQPRDRWDQGMVRMGLVHLDAAKRATRLSRWHLLAGIAAEHAVAVDWQHTDWPSIVGYYEQLVELDPSAAPRLGHAIALAEGGAAAEARERLLALLPETPEALRAHTLAALARAHERLGDLRAARANLEEAILRARHEADARALARRLAALD
jgi:RNA polymerase sigma-70 factor (ECF subfamily)